MNGGFFILIVLVLFVIWLFMVRPQRRRQRMQESMIDELRIGDEVLTAGGFFATVREITEDEVTVELGPGTEARLSKRAIAAVFTEHDAEPQHDPETAPEQEPTEQAQR